MKPIFIPAKVKFRLDKEKIKSLSKELPENIAIAYSIQYKETAYEIKRTLSKNHTITNIIQVLGCSKPEFSKNTQAIFLISDGRFHAISLAYETKIPVYVFDNNNLQRISGKEINSLEKRQKAAYLRFLNADKIGILISTKPGQEKLKKALQLKKHLKDKKSYLFLSNNIDANEFQNFQQIPAWINTACPRLDMNASIVNVEKVI